MIEDCCIKTWFEEDAGIGRSLDTGFRGGKECFHLMEDCCIKTWFGEYMGIGRSGNSRTGEDSGGADDVWVYSSKGGKGGG